MEYCFVTAFYDIGRSSWDNFTRTSENYLQIFGLLCQMKIPIVVYIDSRHLDAVQKLCSDNRPDGVFTQVVAIDGEFLRNNIKSWGYTEREREIMNDEGYKRAIRHRNHCPETKYPEYNCINHAKIDFIKYTIENVVSPEVKYFGWVDFGYVRSTDLMPDDRTFRYEILKNDHVNMIYNNPMDERDRDPVYTLQFAPEKIMGGFWFGSKESLLKYWNIYHEALQSIHSMGIADDDQAVIVHAYMHQKYETIKLWENRMLGSKGWFVGFLLFR